MTRFTLRHSCALGALATAALSATPALAQAEVETAGAATQNENRIVVTGSYIRGTPEDAALPVDVFTADDLAEQGVDSPLEFIKELPSVGASLGDTNQFSTDAQGFQGVGSLNLRGLGPQRTLVLLNGKRTILSPGAGFVDTQLMPLVAFGTPDAERRRCRGSIGQGAARACSSHEPQAGTVVLCRVEPRGRHRHRRRSRSAGR
jgi:outer membrane receptor for ferrienterochelin and colicin